jgi:predicted nucleic acid-binding protein
MIVLIDTGVLGILCRPKPSEEVIQCERWLYELLSRGVNVFTSDICDYEVRRGLKLEEKKGKSTGIEKLNELKDIIDFLPVTAEDLEIASEFWADSVMTGIQTAPESDINIDLIICAQYHQLQKENPGQKVVVATQNFRHLRRFANAEQWKKIKFC